MFFFLKQIFVGLNTTEFSQIEPAALLPPTDSQNLAFPDIDSDISPRLGFKKQKTKRETTIRFLGHRVHFLLQKAFLFLERRERVMEAES